MNPSMNSRNPTLNQPLQPAVPRQCHGAYASIQRLWAVNERLPASTMDHALGMLIVLAPAAHGNDSLPRWMESGASWEQGLQPSHQMRLELTGAQYPEDPEIALRNMLIASECWADPMADGL